MTGVDGSVPAVGQHRLQKTPARASAGRRLGVVTLDQAVSGGSNVLAAVVAARVLSPGSFGLFGILLIIFGLVLGVFRSAVCTPVLMRPVRHNDEVATILGAAWLFILGSCALLLGAAAVSSVVNVEFSGGLVALAACLPLILVQDLSRFFAIGALRPVFALWLDAVWLVVFVVAAALLAGQGTIGLVGMTVLWAGSGALAGLLAVLCWPPLRVPRSGRRWLAHNWHLSWRFTGSFAAAQLSTVVLAFVLRSLLGPVTLAAFLGTQVLTRPYSTVEAALLGSGVAEIAGSDGRRAAVTSHVRQITVVATGVALVNAVVMILLPDAIGVRLLGATWPHAQHFLWPFAVQLVALGLAIGPRVGLVGLNRVHVGFVISVVFVPVLLVVSISGAALLGALGCTWAVTLAWFAVGAVWWVTYARNRDALPG